MRALPSEGRDHWFESSRRGHAAIAQWEERSPGTAEDPGVGSGWWLWIHSGPHAPNGSIGGLTERKGARLLSDGRGQPRQRSIRCPSAQEGMPRWLGAPCFENSDTVLPWGFDTSTFRSGAVVQREHAGPSPRRMSDRNRPASPRRHRIEAVRRVLSPEAGGRYPVAVRGQTSRDLPHAVRSSSAAERVAVNHRRRGFDALLRSFGTVTEDSGTRLQPGPRW
jgi:hypothetical protein